LRGIKGGKRFESINPATGEAISSVPLGQEADVEIGGSGGASSFQTRCGRAWRRAAHNLGKPKDIAGHYQWNNNDGLEQ